MHRHFVALFTALLTTALACKAQLTLDYRHAALDTLTNTYLYSVPEETFGENFAVDRVEWGGHSNIAINGTEASAGYTFTGVNGLSKWTITATDTNGKTVNTSLQFTFLPIVEINGVVEKNVYNTGTVNMFTPDEDIMSPAKMKFRGSATNSHVYQKRNYHIKFQDEEGNKVDYKPVASLRNDNNWLLDAGTLDRLRVRNRVLTDLWLDMGSKPYYIDDEPKALNASRGVMAEVFRNGEYQGIYNLCEPIDRKQLKLKKLDEATGETYGMLWKSGQRSNTTKMMTAPPYNNFMDTWQGFEVQYPDFDDVNPTDWSPLHRVVDFVANSTDEEFAAHASEHLDVPVLMDLYIMMQFILAYDNLGKNAYWATRDHNEGPKLTFAIWDLDTSLGQSWKNYEYHPDYLTPDQDVYTFYTSNIDGFLKRLVKWDVDSFNERTAQRYHELRLGPLATDSIKARFTACIDMLKKSGAAQREQERWRVNPDLGGRPINFDAELAFVNDWIEKRMQWLDEFHFNKHIAGDINRDNTVDISDVNMQISQILGRGGAPDIYTYRCDLIPDKVIDIEDFNILINKILGR